MCACSILRRIPGKAGSDGQALAALSTASIDDLAAVLGAHAGQKAMNFLAMTLLGLKSSLHGCILRKNSSPVMGYFWSQIGDRLAIQQYIAHYPLLSSIFFTFQQTFFKFLCEKAFNFFTGSAVENFSSTISCGQKPPWTQEPRGHDGASFLMYYKLHYRI